MSSHDGGGAQVGGIRALQHSSDPTSLPKFDQTARNDVVTYTFLCKESFMKHTTREREASSLFLSSVYNLKKVSLFQ